MANLTQAQTFIRWLWIPVLLVCCYTGWVFYSRQSGNRAAEEEVQQKRAESDRQLLEKLGGSDLKILMFYANPPVVRRGQPGLLCYGVSNSKSVRMEPSVDGVGPAISRCVEIRPAASTEYKIIATDDKGREVSQSLQVQVQ